LAAVFTGAAGFDAGEGLDVLAAGFCAGFAGAGLVFWAATVFMTGFAGAVDLPFGEAAAPLAATCFLWTAAPAAAFELEEDFWGGLALDLAAGLGTCLDLGATGLAVVAFEAFAVAFELAAVLAAFFDAGRVLARALGEAMEAVETFAFGALLLAAFWAAVWAAFALAAALAGAALLGAFPAVALAVFEDAFSLAEDIDDEPLGLELEPFEPEPFTGLAAGVFFCAALGEEAAARCLDLDGIPVSRELDFSPLRSRGFGYRKGEKGRAISKRRFCRSRIC
jgi:hypothetical protein